MSLTQRDDVFLVGLCSMHQFLKCNEVDQFQASQLNWTLGETFILGVLTTWILNYVYHQPFGLELFDTDSLDACKNSS